MALPTKPLNGLYFDHKRIETMPNNYEPSLLITGECEPPKEVKGAV